jgi:hypothetical protein
MFSAKRIVIKNNKLALKILLIEKAQFLSYFKKLRSDGWSEH